MLTRQWTSGPRKAAILLATLGSEISAQVLRYLTDREIEQVTAELLALDDLRSLDPEVQNEVLDEAYRMSMVEGGLPSSGLEYVWEVLAQVLGETGANELIKRIRSGNTGVPFGFMEDTDPAQLAKFLEDEHPQTIALILSHLRPRHAAQILSHLSPELQRELAERIVLMEQTAPDVVQEVERGLTRKLSPMLSYTDYRTVRGVDSLVDILKLVNRSTEKTILEHLSETNPQLADQVRQKMFVFEDLVLLDDRSVQRVLREIDPKDLPLALKGAPAQIRDLIFRNMSTRARQMLQEELETMGPQRVTNVEKAQQRIVDVVRRLEEAEEIIVARGGVSEVVL